MTWDAWKEHARIGRIRFKRHRSRAKRKDAKTIMRAHIKTHDKLRAEIAAQQYEAKVSVLFAGLGGKA